MINVFKWNNLIWKGPKPEHGQSMKTWKNGFQPTRDRLQSFCAFWHKNLSLFFLLFFFAKRIIFTIFMHRWPTICNLCHWFQVNRQLYHLFNAIIRGEWRHVNRISWPDNVHVWEYENYSSPKSFILLLTRWDLSEGLQWMTYNINQCADRR